MIPNLDLLLCDACALVAIGFLPDYSTKDDLPSVAAEMARCAGVLFRAGVVDEVWMSAMPALIAKAESHTQPTLTMAS